MPTFVQIFQAQVSPILAWSQNGGVFPTPYSSQVKVFQNGQLLLDTTDYSLSVGSIVVSGAVHADDAIYVVYAESVALTVTGSGVACLDTIVGLDSEPCECYETGRPEDYNQSDSGYYLTDPEYGVPMQDGILASAGCADGDLWDILSKARTRSIVDFQVDIKAALDTGKRTAFNPWNGVIGKPSANRSRTEQRAYAGRVIKPKKRSRHQKLVITDLYLGVDFTGDVDVILNSNAFGFTRLTATISATSGIFVKHTLSTAWELDLYQAETPDLYYTISYEVNGNQIRDNKIWCCSAPGWINTVYDFGFSSDTETKDFSESHSNNQQGLGLAYAAYLYCDEMAWICELDQLGGKQMKSLLGRAVVYKSTVKILSQMLESGKINQHSLLNVDQGFQRMAYAQERYNEIITWIAQNLPSGYSGCFSCNNDTMKVVNLIA